MGEQLPEIDRAAAEVMWRAYCDAHPNAVAATAEYTVEYFGDSPALADELLGLVLAGTKRATAALVDEFVAEGEALPRIGRETRAQPREHIVGHGHLWRQHRQRHRPQRQPGLPRQPATRPRARYLRDRDHPMP